MLKRIIRRDRAGRPRRTAGESGVLPGYTATTARKMQRAKRPGPGHDRPFSGERIVAGHLPEGVRTGPV